MTSVAEGTRLSAAEAVPDAGPLEAVPVELEPDPPVGRVQPVKAIAVQRRRITQTVILYCIRDRMSGTDMIVVFQHLSAKSAKGKMEKGTGQILN